ncbi:phospholipid methyltransferase-domain-containing protein [Blastocladiella britannica]|nr:phospholipid methyltransferase-domain-containing protein [Blastocladiella britannica]
MADSDTGLRHRASPASTTATESTAVGDNTDKGEQMHGVTPSGTVFALPKTADMLTSVFGHLAPNKPTSSADGKNARAPEANLFDFATVAIMGTQIALYFFTPLPRWVFLFLFLFWRAAYNAGLGYILKRQSDERWLQGVVVENGWFDAAKNPVAAKFFKREFERKMGGEYSFEAMPLEFNTWLLYRSIVDLVLINDFATYCIFFFAYWDWSNFGFTDLARLATGLVVLVFNLWVKVDAHRVVKDFAWYWGDFFFLLNNPSLTFDGVFEMAPHPMYSVGYAGYYGVALITGSYTVLFVSLVAHFGQLAFLTYVENPHIFKTYGKDRHLPHQILSNPAYMRVFRTYFARDLVGVVRNVDVYRAPDLFTLVICGYAIVTGLIGTRAFATAQAAVWIAFHSGVLGYVLHAQSTRRAWTRHFIQFGGSNKDAFEHWKPIYNLSISMLYIAFTVAALKNYYVPDDWTVGTFVLRHTVGAVLILLHGWTAVSVHEVLGDFGYFFGDFFIDRAELPTELFYTGIYRFVNNPEKIMGHSAFWGLALMSGSWTMAALAIGSQAANFAFLRLVEEPHMTRLYGSAVRKESGAVKLVRERVAPLVARVVSPPATAGANVTAAVVPDQQTDVARSAPAAVAAAGTPSVAARLQNVSESVRSSGVAVVDSVGGASAAAGSAAALAPTARALYAVHLDHSTSGKAEYGAPIRVAYSIPRGLAGRRDWIALYRVAGPYATSVPANSVPVLATTPVSSAGRWKYLNNAQDAPIVPVGSDAAAADADVQSGTVTFEGAAAPWTPGWYEARVHYDESHTVVAVSPPFQMTAPQLPGSTSTDGATDAMAARPDPTPADLARLLVAAFDDGSLVPPPVLASAAAGASPPAAVLDLDVFSTTAADGDSAVVPPHVARRMLAAMATVYGVDFHVAALVQFGSLAVLANRLSAARVALGSRPASRAAPLVADEEGEGEDEEE